MSAHLLKFNPRNGIPLVEHFASVAEMTQYYNGHPQGVPITTPAELAMVKEQYQGNKFVMPLLERIDPDDLG